jgi:hypothetical protein
MTITALPAPTPTPGCEATSQLPLLLLGMRWLYDTEQPDIAIARSDGEALPSTGGRTLRFIPRGHPGGTVVCIESTVPAADSRPVTPAELDAFAGLLEDLDVDIHRRWIKYPRASGCLALRAPAHPSLCAAVARYQRGCPVHHHRNLCTCTESVEGRAALISLAQLKHQALTAAATIPALAGPWPLFLDPSGELRQVALTQYRPLSLCANAFGGSVGSDSQG